MLLYILKRIKTSLGVLLNIPFYVGYYNEEYPPPGDAGYVYAQSFSLIPYENRISFHIIADVIVSNKNFVFIDGVSENYNTAMEYIKKINSLIFSELWKNVGIIEVTTDIANIRNDLLVVTFNFQIKNKIGFLK